MNREDNLCWFHGKVSRDKAEQILREDGMGDGVFLVRESNSSVGDYVLSVLHEGQIWHYQIRRHGEDAFFSIDDQTPIHGLDSLIEHYQNASNGLVTRLSAIVKRDPPPHDSRSHGRTNLLHRATKEGDFTVVSELLKCGYRNIDAKNKDGETAVHLVCKYGNERILQKLIDSGANVNCRDSKGNTPLHYACHSQPASVIKLLIMAKANIQARNNETGCVPLHDAAQHGNLEAIKELLSNNAPHMPRSSFGEFASDFAKEYGHKDIFEFLENYTPPPATTYKYQWYHGTLKRIEAEQVIKEFAANIRTENEKKRISSDETTKSINNTSNGDISTPKDENISSSYSTINEQSNEQTDNVDDDITNGVFLIRCSDRNNGGYVLTLLYENQPKHFIIVLKQNYLSIDEGPYMNSLEHLVQHYKLFSDGLPIKLKYAVPPKPNPPLPLYRVTLKKQISSTHRNVDIPKSDAVSPDSQVKTFLRMDKKPSVVGNVFGRNKSDSNFPIPKVSPQRNLSVPADSDMNKVGLFESGQSPPSKLGSSDILNLRSLKLKSPKKKNIILDGMRSLRRSKPKNLQKKEDAEVNNLKHIELEQTMLKNLSFSTDFLPSISGNASVYNIPTNNNAIEECTTDDTVQNENNQNEENKKMVDANEMRVDYFTESDIKNDTNINGEEEIYFIDAPPDKSFTAALDLSIPSNNNAFIINPSGYIAMKSVPVFSDSPSVNAIDKTNDNNDNNLSQGSVQTPSVSPPRAERLDSTMSTISIISESEFPHLLQQQTSLESLTSIKGCDSSLNGVNIKPAYFIRKDDLVLEELLGEGEFGCVYKGALLVDGILTNSEKVKEDEIAGNEATIKSASVTKIPVAIKTLHDANSHKNRELLREANVMIQLKHHCIVSLIGIAKGPPIMLVQELVPLGSMLTFILDNPQQINPNFELKIWASQIACGMNYLESNHFVHRDLAARNILLASRNQAKISDFGLSRALCANNYYQATQGGQWPIKWYAPESFNYGTFSHASDVWSYGVTLWEMFSLGQAPYGDIKGVEVIKLIDNGKRLAKPTLCPDNVFSIMENCWNYNPRDRPTFRYLTEFFANDPDYQNLTELVKTEHIS